MSLFFELIRYRFSKPKSNVCSFLSFDGHCSDSPYFISKEIYRLRPDIIQYWIVKDQYRQYVPNYAVAVRFKSKEAARIIRESKFIVDNVYGPYAYAVSSEPLSKVKGLLFRLFSFKKSQRVYTTWHGNSLKKGGRDQIGNDITNLYCGNLTIFSGALFTQKIMYHQSFGKAKMILLGTPRNDFLFLKENDIQIKTQLRLPVDKKIVLFAPTFRNDGKDVEEKNIERSGLNQIKEIDFFRLLGALNKRFGGDFVFVLRFHYHVMSLIDWGALSKQYPGIIINGNSNDDMSLYLKVADVLITDASSCMYDFSLKKSPCFLFFPDLISYQNKERGFYIPIEELPFACSTSFDDLLNSINRFDPHEYLSNIEKMHKKLGFVDDGHSTARIAKYILADNCL